MGIVWGRGGNCPEGNCHRWELSGGNRPGAIVLSGNCLEGNCLGGNCPWENFPVSVVAEHVIKS